MAYETTDGKQTRMNAWTADMADSVIVSMMGVVQDGQLPTTVPSMDGGVPAQPGAGTGAPAGPAGGAGSGTATPPSPFGGMFGLVLFGLLAFMILTTMMSSRKEKKKQAEMISSLKRGDRVQMLGGMIGKIDQVKEDAIVVRVDEVNGTKIHFAKSAVQRVLESSKPSHDTST